MQIDGNITLKNLFDIGISSLKKAQIEAPVLEAGVMLCNLLNINRALLYAKSDEIIRPEVSAEYIEFIKRRSDGTPLQYITGHQEFMSLDFKVTPDVLIPRQDTEILVETVIEHAKKMTARPLRILDIGTGSGCIAISLAHYIKDCSITAIDISKNALKVAEFNAEAIGVRDKISFIELDILGSSTFYCTDTVHKPIPAKAFGDFHIIVSNPPYIPSDEIPLLQKEVRNHEPVGALDGGKDGLNFYREIILKSQSLLAEGGLLAFEAGYNQAQDVKELMALKSFDVAIHKDLSGIARVVAGIRDFTHSKT
ncbi:peptide chain release factor N(5)-glutamine methyltransferase [Pseudobacteroides cellulosolvens]|uniref:Release factor glutamine methyltransferase n=1 Tax=Pseudobacteroides cellulosolvens ATCC 35603 = DSM 2933 TaxID=398512 RepID=A0A0L6JXC5_9FIRM|nr:peptide chain release factor N(5)-glutamine methyltransferase [Pseudobacteroides cellulosolvens]KNY30220.1 Protein-(glutamine-N5) methyltransferase, release factor-specific [Pseudobacteroides cellulosolvens ATCC 35603 = DSM 2933]